MQRSFFVLQGTASPFFTRLCSVLKARGHLIHRVSFCGGDVLYGEESEKDLLYTGRLENLTSWYAAAISAHKFTDVLMFGDCREIHRPIHDLAEAAGIRLHVFEEGYVRPHWLTLERHGVNGRSRLPRDPSWYMERRGSTPSSPPGNATGYNLRDRAWHDIRYRLANFMFAKRFPHYKSHRPRNGLIEYIGLARRALRQKAFDLEAKATTRAVLAGDRPYFLFPLQLNSDAQMVVHSPFESVFCAIEDVLRSFARHAPADALLVLKNHPLDTGLIDYRGLSARLSEELKIADRVHFIDAGHLPTLLEHAQGVVVVNSTVGLSALHHGCRLIALGSAIYDMQGLTWQSGLDTFWRDATVPDIELYRAFLDYVVHYTQINGDFYTKTGIEMAVAGAVHRLVAADA